MKSDSNKKAFEAWVELNSDLRDKLDTAPREVLIYLVLRKWWESLLSEAAAEKILSKLIAIGEILEVLNDDTIDGKTAISRIKSYSSKTTQKENLGKYKDAFKTVDTLIKNLAEGRKIGTKKRTEKSTNRINKVTQVIEKLFASGEGWKMNNEAITDLLIDHYNIDFYERSTLLNTVKGIAARIRNQKRHYSGQKNS